MFLALVHLRTITCPTCREVLATEGARSIIVDEAGDPVVFSTEDQPEGLDVVLACSLEHEIELSVPLNISVESVEMTPDDAPLAVDARVVD